jgi:hypothetical protein
MTVPVQVPITTTTANGVTAVFPFGFKVAKAADLRVTVNGLGRVLGTHFTVDNLTDAGGNLTFTDDNVPPSGAKVVMRRLMAFERTTAYQNLGDLLASTLNADQDDPVMMIQQLAAAALQLVEDPNNPGAFAWDAQGYRLIRLGNGVDPTDAVNLGQLVDAAGGTGSPLGINPKLWDFTGDGDTTDFAIPGADVFNPLFYDTALAGEVLEPDVDYTILEGGDGLDPVIRLATAPANGAKGFAVLRGYARAYNGDAPITTVAPTVTIVDTLAGTIDNSYQNTIIGITSASDVTLTIRKNTGASNDWGAGEFFSVIQLGTGKVTLAVETGGTLDPSPGYLPATRGLKSVISATCLYPDADEWAITGDLLAEAATPDMQCFTLPCSDEATTDVAVATDVYRFRMPYGLLVTDVRATLNVAQPSGSLLTVDVKQAGTSIFSTPITLDNAETASTTASAPAVLANPTSTWFVDGDLISVDVTQVGTAGARGLKVQLIGQRA